jgi:AcrR family transcriptional regulator
VTTHDQPVRPPRPRDAAASKHVLLEAARVLFGQQGFERTTTREIGERAGVDAALIARYFGSKADLYIAAVVAESQGYRPTDSFERPSDIARTLLELADAHGLGPVTQALIRSDTGPEIKEAARGHIARRLVIPMIADMERRGIEQPHLRAEIVVSALIGVILARALEWFDEMAAADRDDLLTLLTTMFEPDAPACDRVEGA